MDAQPEGLVMVHVAEPRHRSERRRDRFPAVLAALVLAGVLVKPHRAVARLPIVEQQVFEARQRVELLRVVDGAALGGWRIDNRGTKHG